MNKDKSGQHHPGSVKRSGLRSESKQLDQGNGYSPKSMGRGEDSSARFEGKRRDHESESGAADSASKGLWAPKRVPVQPLLEASDVARRQLIWLTFSILATTVIGGAGAIVFLALQAIDTAPLLQYLITVTTLEFAAAMVVLRHHFGKKGN